MDQSAVQQGWKRSENFLFDQQGGDQEDSNLPLGDLSDFEWNNVGHSQIATNPTGQAEAIIRLRHSQIVFPGLEQSSSADLPLNLIDTESQFPAHNESALLASKLPLNAIDTDQFSADVQSFQQTLFPRPQSNDTLNSSLIPCNPTDYAAFSTFKQPLTGRCVRCWALRKKVFLLLNNNSIAN